MRRSYTLTILGLLMGISSSSLLHGQEVRPISYDDLVARLEAVESELASKQDVAPVPLPAYRPSRCNTCPGVRGGLFASYENVWVKPFFNHNAAYEVFDTLPNVGEDVQVVEFGWDFKNTPRIEFGYITSGSGFGWRTRYWQFDNSASRSASDPFLTGGGDGRIEVGLHDDPDVEVSTGNNEAVATTHGLQLDVLDLEIMKRRETACRSVTYSGGLRYLRMDQSYRADFVNVNTGIADDVLTSDHTFEGLGPTLAVEGDRRLGASSFSLFGKTRGSLLLGDSSLRQASTDPQNVNAPIRDFFATGNSHDLLFIGELQLGVRYERLLSSGKVLFGTLGTEFQYWPSGGSGSYQNGEDSDGQGADPRDSDMALLGLSVSIGTKW